MNDMPTGIGAAVKRREDFGFLKGIGRYTDDINQPGQTYCVLLRSPIAHATINARERTQPINLSPVHPAAGENRDTFCRPPHVTKSP